MSVINSAVSWIIGIANDNSHGYDQASRWGSPDYDCSSLVISAFKQAGVPLTCTYTGNMYSNMIANGFVNVTNSCNLVTGAGMQAGDVLLNTVNHTAMYIGNGNLVQASINEKGTVSGGQKGDQTGKEIYSRSYYNYPWNYVLRYQGKENTTNSPSSPNSNPNANKNYVKVAITVPMIECGDEGKAVAALQALLCSWGYKCDIDGEFGRDTENKLKQFQTSKRLEVDGVCGKNSWNALFT